MNPTDPEGQDNKQPAENVSAASDFKAEGIDLTEGLAPMNENSEPAKPLQVTPQEPTSNYEDLKNPIVKDVTSAQGEKTVQGQQEIDALLWGIPGLGPDSQKKGTIPTVKNDPSIKPLRTFKSDAEEAIKYQNVSAINIAVAEQKKRELMPEPVEEKTSHAGIIFVVLLLLLLTGAGTAGWYYWPTLSKNFSFPTANVPLVPQVKINTILPYTKGTAIIGANDNSLSAIADKISKADLVLGDIYVVLPVLTSTSTSQLSVDTIFASTHMPNRLIRSLSNSYMLGSYMGDKNSPFIILRPTFFQNAFAGMLEWEKDMRNDLVSFIRETYPGETSVSTNTDVFEDTVVLNTDTRILKNDSGDVILAYAFADKDTIVITTNANSLKYLLGQLLAVKIIQ